MSTIHISELRFDTGPISEHPDEEDLVVLVHRVVGDSFGVHIVKGLPLAGEPDPAGVSTRAWGLFPSETVLKWVLSGEPLLRTDHMESAEVKEFVRTEVVPMEWHERPDIIIRAVALFRPMKGSLRHAYRSFADEAFADGLAELVLVEPY